MHDLLTAYDERRRADLRTLGGVIAAAVNAPKELDKMFKDKPVVEAQPVDPEQFEKWW